jgi:hypothetical protein
MVAIHRKINGGQYTTIVLNIAYYLFFWQEVYIGELWMINTYDRFKNLNFKL